MSQNSLAECISRVRNRYEQIKTKLVRNSTGDNPDGTLFHLDLYVAPLKVR